FLFCDTNFVQTMIYSELYFEDNDRILENYVNKLKYDLYLLTFIDAPWEEDELRDAPLEREFHYTYFKKRLMESNLPFIEVSGTEQERKQKAIRIANDLELAKSRGFSGDDLAYFEQRGISIQ